MTAENNLALVVREVCTADVEPDGMVFDPATVKTERIKEDADYEGVRVRLVGLLVLSEFLLPIGRACAHGGSFDERWSPGGPWTTGA